MLYANDCFPIFTATAPKIIPSAFSGFVLRLANDKFFLELIKYYIN